MAVSCAPGNRLTSVYDRSIILLDELKIDQGDNSADIIQTFYDDLASQYDKLFLDWQATTQEHAVIVVWMFPEETGFYQPIVVAKK